MPNWVEQDFVVIGPQEDIDRFCGLAVTGNLRSDHTLEDEPTFLFDKVCPVRKGDEAADDEHEEGVLYRFVRTRVQALFTIQTSWDYPAHFYTRRLLRDWPRVSFCCAVNEDMHQFGGILAGFDGVAVNAVEDYGPSYNSGAHGRHARKLLVRWDALVNDGRLWLVDLMPRLFRHQAWNIDATFDDTAKQLTFRTEEEARRFARRFKGANLLHRSARPGAMWRRVTHTGNKGSGRFGTRPLGR